MSVDQRSLTYTVSSALQKLNIQIILVTLPVSQQLTSRVVRLEQYPNISLI